MEEKLAQMLRKEDKVLLQKTDNKEYILATSYFAICLTFTEFVQFKKKWNSYKSTVEIPELSKLPKNAILSDTNNWQEIEYSEWRGEDNEELQKTIEEAGISQRVQLLPLYFRAVTIDNIYRMFRVEKMGKGMVDSKYDFLLDNSDLNYYSHGPQTELVGCKNEKRKVVIMPCRVSYLNDELQKNNISIEFLHKSAKEANNE